MDSRGGLGFYLRQLAATASRESGLAAAAAARRNGQTGDREGEKESDENIWIGEFIYIGDEG